MIRIHELTIEPFSFQYVQPEALDRDSLIPALLIQVQIQIRHRDRIGPPRTSPRPYQHGMRVCVRCYAS